MEGLRRLEYRGIRLGGGGAAASQGIVTAKRSGKLDRLREALATDPLPASFTGIGHTRWATHGGPTDANAHPHLGGSGSGGGDPQRHHRELRRPQGRAGRRGGGVRQSDRHRGGRAPAGQGLRRGRRPGRRDAGRSPAGWRVPSRCWRCTPTSPGWWSAARRELAAGGRGRRGGELPRVRRRGVHRLHPGGDRARPGPGGHDHARARSRSPTSPAMAVQGRQFHVDWDAAAAEKGGYPTFMAKEIDEQPHAVADTLLRAHRRRRSADARRAARSTRPCCGASTRSSWSPVAPLPTRAWSPSTRSSTGCGSRSRSSWRTSSATATRS